MFFLSGKVIFTKWAKLQTWHHRVIEARKLKPIKYYP